ncbi:hypothetical protein EHO61_16325 [Leptospira fluminis]|uniref:Uncharacterized protein n=1 Tax=Leptospira fluminis TaxID=2484979 RepID=A0A4V3JE81_9LEPT|nr:hypothetical protein [Leptospira fluminis]TGK15246.1 hypothetical protein EHO61_16325 [Leptospira fluminis]
MVQRIFLQRVIIVLLATITLCPTKQDGVADLTLIGLDQGEPPFAANSEVAKSHSVESISGEHSRHFAFSFRNRFDFMDYFCEVLVGSDSLETLRHFCPVLFSSYSYTRLISSLLLNIPPPVAI